MLKPRLCTARDFASGWYAEYLNLAKEGAILHRKQWEFAAITQVLRERGMLRAGKSGIGFAVGREPLPALFASMGATVLATDQAVTAASRSLWGADQLCFAPDRVVDMRNLPEDLGEFDFLWSAGSFEHIGGLDAGLVFVAAAMRHLKPGGVAVHTTEFNCGPGMDTLESEHLSLYRKADFARLSKVLAAQGDRLLPIDYSQGSDPADRHVNDGQGPLPHLKLRIGEFVTTSILIIVEKAS